MPKDNTETVKNKPKRHSIFRDLIFWFLLLSLLPLSLTSWLNYQKARNSLVAAAEHQLIQDSVATREFISNWFDYRLMDINNQATLSVNAAFLQRLSYGWFRSELPLSEYIKSYDWQFRTDVSQDSLINFSSQYDYIHDLFLIDTQGNILFSAKRESDLGVNLKSPEFRNTKFSKSVFSTIASQQVTFSDLERYAPSNNQLAAFLSAPLFDDEGMMLGVITMQLHLDRIFARMIHQDDQHSSMIHYLVAQDALLRSPISEDFKTVLTTKIASEQFLLWMSEHKGDKKETHNEMIFEYLGPFGKKVFGVHNLISILDVKWALISEINSEEIFVSSNDIAKTFFYILLLTIVLIVIISIIQVKRITDPIQILVRASLNIAQGKTDQHVEVSTNNEIGQLADAFNEMVRKRNQTELEIKNNNVKLQDALSELSSQQYALDQHAIVAITDIKGTITFVNDKFCEISGYNHDQLIDQNHRILNSGIHQQSFFKEMYQTIKAGKVWNGDICNRKKSGELYWVNTTIVPFKDQNGRPQSYVAIRTDITEQKAAERQQANNLKTAAVKLDITKSLSAHTAFSNRLFDALGYSLELPDFGFNNKACIYIYDEQAAEFILSSRIGDFAADDADKKAVLDLCQSCINSETLQVIEQCDETCCAEEHPHGHYILPLKNNLSNDDSDEHPLVGILLLFTQKNVKLNVQQENILHDLSDIFSTAVIREKASKQLREATITAQQNSQLKGDFLASMSHEIRTPMNGVLGMLGLLLNSKLNEDQLHKASLAKSSAESLLVLINDILDFSKVEAGKMELDIINFNLREMFGELSEAMALHAQEKGVEIILDLTRVDHSMVKGDPGRLRQILTNLISNAVKFTDQGEIRITAATHNSQEEIIDFSCSVEDSGIGIPQDKISTLFEIFTQVDTSTTRKYGGTGLGLAICHKLCSLMGGEIHAQSETDKGSTFTFTAKLQVSHQSQKVLPRVDISKLQLLIVDDNATNREVLRGQLEHWGAAVSEAEDGRQALQICTDRLADNKDIFDVAFLDMQMPEMDGAQLGQLLRSNSELNEMKLVMMTSIASQNETQFFADLGFDAYFPKPATTSDLFDALNVVVDNGEALKQASPLVTHDYLRSLAHTNNAPERREADKSLIKILLVEDNKVNQLVALGILEELGFSADVAENGQQALSTLQVSLKSRVYQLIFMDCQMPVMDGYEATKAIRKGEAGQAYIDIPIIAMTANAMTGDRDKCLDSGMDDYICKPIDPKLLETKLAHWLAGAAGYIVNTKQQAAELQTSLLCWDKADALHRVLNKEQLLITLVKTFIDEIPCKIDELSDAVSDHDQHQVRVLAHTIKGVSANLSALALAFYCSELEKAAEMNNPEPFTKAFSFVKQSYTELTAEFSVYLQAVDNKPEQEVVVKAALTEEKMLNLLEQLAVRLQQNDYIESEEVSPLIESCLAADMKEKFINLQELITLFDLANASRLVEQIIDEIYKLPHSLPQED